MNARLLAIALPVTLMIGCVSAPVTLTESESPYSESLQREAQQQATAAPEQLALKRKIAVARLSNETTYGKGLLTENSADRTVEKISDMFIQGLSNSGNYLIFERRDLELLQAESEFSGITQDIIGVDTLVIGSLTEFGRATTGTSGFLSSTKKQEATATIDLRLVDVASGQIIHSITGTGTSSTETKSTMGFGSVAAYDGSINDRAIGAAVNAVVGKLDEFMLQKPWSADVLAIEDGLVYISGGKSQGVHQGLKLGIYTKGQKVKSETTGAVITLPGKKIATVEVVALFGDTELEEGSTAQIISGSLTGQNTADLLAREEK
ncbi:CsgG/HfaB family protein [Reinekea marinisedimentorum]|uniref:Curli production assembly/transport component CsgG n=1 Tax=Reinekea marinisedimentorum TaxID=230495 RepID=A0A4R3IER0_9GAMM|nr:CsgG/HfaB family protein [Reinekea marinisedimentorum]TCS43281.1 curli biogenesis system outer membrane secretion channel CsgG [Reinekea marinisedimentorum]